MLNVENISKQYLMNAQQNPSDDSSYVLKDLSFTLQQGQRMVITGPSGSGKSTLLNIIGTLDKPTIGSVRLNGTNITKLEESEQAQLRNQNIGFIFQLHHLLPQCTLLENVLIPTLANRNTNQSQTIDHAKKLLDRVGLSDRINHYPGQLSGGQRQRTAIVRALINNPTILLADEPTGALDKAASDTLAELLIELNEQDNLTLIVATHSTTLASQIGNVWQFQNKTLLQGDCNA